MNATTSTLLRSVLKIGGGFLVSKGIADESTSEVIVAGLVAVTGVIFGYFAKKPIVIAPGAEPVAADPLTRAGVLPLPLLACALIPLVLGTGCAINRPSLTETTSTARDGTVTFVRKLTVRSYVIWPATSSLDRQTASLGKTLTVGTHGMDQESGGTNVVQALHEISTIVQAIPH